MAKLTLFYDTGRDKGEYRYVVRGTGAVRYRGEHPAAMSAEDPKRDPGARIYPLLRRKKTNPGNMDDQKTNPVPRLSFCGHRTVGGAVSKTERNLRSDETDRHRTGDRAPYREREILSPGIRGRRAAGVHVRGCDRTFGDPHHLRPPAGQRRLHPENRPPQAEGLAGTGTVRPHPDGAGGSGDRGEECIKEDIGRKRGKVPVRGFFLWGKTGRKDKKMKIPFSPPDMTELEVKGAADAIISGWITTGPKTKEFERRIAEYCHVKKAVCLNSQTSCAEMALRLLGIGEQNGGSSSDEVIVPAYTYTASAAVVCHTGAKLVLIDSQTDSLEMDYDAVENAINEHTKAIIPVDLGGIPCDYDRIFTIVENKKHLFKATSTVQEAVGRVAICADAAHAFGAKWHDRMVGSIADFSSFSFHAVNVFETES